MKIPIEGPGAGDEVAVSGDNSVSFLGIDELMAPAMMITGHTEKDHTS